MARKTYKYHFKMGKKTLYSGVTKDLEKRERELKQEFGEDGYIKQVGGRDHDGRSSRMGERTGAMGQPHQKGLGQEVGQVSIELQNNDEQYLKVLEEIKKQYQKYLEISELYKLLRSKEPEYIQYQPPSLEHPLTTNKTCT